MDFQADKPIYLQIADGICDRILSGELASADRIPSVREYGEKILEQQRRVFLEKEVPAIKARMNLLGLDPAIFKD